MPKVIFLKGLPASGKSTWAINLVETEKGKWKRISKDSLRSMLDNNRWSGKNEKFVIAIRNTLIVESLKAGWNVIVDDTNLNPIHEKVIREIAEEQQAEFETKDFTEVPLEECIKRDQKRQNYVGEKVIREMHNKFLKPKSETYIYDKNLLDCIICDIDGTLALFGNKNPYERDFTQDDVNRPIAEILNNTKKTKILVSGRQDKFRNQTEEWLKDNKIKFDYLYMRPTGDLRKDFVIKEEIFNNEIKGKFNVRFILDDRNQTVQMWRSLGMTCLQVNYGDF